MEKKENKNKHEVEVTIEGENWEKALEKAYDKNKKKVKMDGFRPGKVPFDMYVKKNGYEALYEDAINNVLAPAFDKALDESKLEPIVQPTVDVINISKDKIDLKFTIITKPDVNIKKYKDLKIKKDKLEVTKEEIEHEIEHLLEHYAELVVKDGKALEGDTVIIDYEGSIDGVPFEGGKAEDYSLVLGSNTFIPGFEEQLIGTSKEEEKDVKVTFPEDYHAENLKGKDAIFKVKVHEIKTKKNRELDSDFFEDLGMEGVDSKESLENNIKEHLETHKREDIENKFVDDVMDAISKNTDIDIPEEMVEEEIDRLIKRAEENLRYQGITLDLYYQFTKTTEQDLRNNLEKEAFKNVLYRLILDEIKVLEKIEVTDEEIDEEIEKTAKLYNASKEEIEKELGGRIAIKYSLEAQKTFDRLEDYNKVE